MTDKDLFSFTCYGVRCGIVGHYQERQCYSGICEIRKISVLSRNFEIGVFITCCRCHEGTGVGLNCWKTAIKGQMAWYL